MLVEENLQEWIIENYELYERVILACMFIDFSEFSSPTITKTSQMGIHNPTDDILPMIKFSR